MRYYLLLGAVIAAALAYSGFWFYAADRFEDGIDQWAVAQRTQDVSVDYGAIDRSGFPFRLETTVAEPRIGLPTQRGGLSWQGRQIASLTHLWNLRHFLVSAKGPHRIDFVDPRGTARAFTGQTTRALASYQQDGDGRLALFSVDIRDAEFTEAATSARLWAKRAQLHVRPGTVAEASLDIAVKGEALELENLIAMPAPVALALLQLDASIVGRLDGALTPASIAAWRDEGGTIEIRNLQVDWADVRINLAGSIALDREMRPIGALTAQINGHQALLDALVDAGQMAEDDAGSAKSVLDLLTIAGGGVLSVPVRMQDGVLFLGPVRLARLNPLFSPGGRNPAPASPDRPQ